MKRQILIALIVIAILALVFVGVYLMPPQASWDTSPETLIIAVKYYGEVDYNYIPFAQIWGNGHVIWVEHTSTGTRQVLEGYLSHEVMTDLVYKIIDLGFFNGYRIPNIDLFTGDYLEVNLSGARHEGEIDAKNKALSEVVGFLRSGAGVKGTEFLPTSARLLAYPVEEVGIPASTIAHYQWPSEKYGHDLESVYTHKPYNEINIYGDELVFAWEIVNSSNPVVESNGKKYWIAVIIPGVSL